MKLRILKAYKELGIDFNKDSLLGEYIDILNESEFSKKDFELFHMDLILGLTEIKEFEYNSFKRYQNNLNKSKNNLSFWGERYEVFWHSKLIKYQKLNSNVSGLKRGIDGKEPDLIFNYQNEDIGIELTTLKFNSGLKNVEEIFKKIIDSIFKKNSNPYANVNHALIIDVTNLNYHSKFTKMNLKEIFKEYPNEVNYLIDSLKFGMVILCQSEFRIKEGNNRSQYLKPIFGISSRGNPINEGLLRFLKLFFNNSEVESDYEVHYHKYI